MFVPGLWWFPDFEVLCTLCDWKSPWNFESVSRETRELEFSSSGSAHSAAVPSGRGLPAVTATEAEEGTRLGLGM